MRQSTVWIIVVILVVIVVAWIWYGQMTGSPETLIEPTLIPTTDIPANGSPTMTNEEATTVPASP